jgi:hypothetical protein
VCLTASGLLLTYAVLGWQDDIDHQPIHWSAILTSVGAIVAGVGVVFVWQSVRESERARFAQMATEFSRRWGEEALVEVRRKTRDYSTVDQLAVAFKAYRDSNAAEYYLLLRELDFFEDLGAAERIKSVSPEFVDLTLGTTVVDRWEMWEPAITLVWDGDPYAYNQFRELARRIKARLATDDED